MADKPTSPPPAYFLSLSLENVRSFGEKQTISFATKQGRPAQWTIILGDNGVGKTTVLKSLAALMPVKFSEYKDDSFIINKNINYDDFYMAAYQLDRNLKSIWPLYRQVIDIYSILTASVQLGKKLVGEVIGTVENTTIGLETNGPKSKSPREGAVPNGLIIYGYGAGRTTGNSSLSEMPENQYAYTSLFNDRADLLNPEEWFLQMEYSSLKEDEQAAKALEQVRQTLLKVLPDVADIRISSKSRQQYLELQTPYGWVRLRDMSLGYQTLVVWLTDFASKLFIRYPDSPNPLEEPAIVLIDEIDLHLHPSWQRKLIGFLSDIFRNTQFIATAHSPLVVQAATDAEANVVLLKREGDQTIVHQNTEDVRGWRLDQILTSELFGLETARSLDTEHKLKRRAELLINSRRTAAENQELATLTRELNAEPVGETPSEREVDSVLQELRQRLRQQDAPAA